MITWMKRIIPKQQKFSFRVLIFCQLQPAVTYESVAYMKKACVQILEFLNIEFHDVIKCLSMKQEIRFTE